MDAAEIEASFLAVKFRRTLEKLGARVGDPDFWRALNPDLTISDAPIGADAEPYVSPIDPAHLALGVHEEGHFVTPPIVPPADVARLRAGIERVVEIGLPAGFAFVYDDYFKLYARLAPVVEPVLGPSPLLLPNDFWVFHVPAGDAARTRWTAFSPHRDWIGPDPALMAGAPPTVLVCWVALTDVSTADSCLYVVPADADPDYRTATRDVVRDHIRLQDIRALPVNAGSVVFLTTHVIHWGSRSSAGASRARVSLSIFFQRRDVPPFDEWTVDFSRPVPFADRLHWIYDTMRMMMTTDQVRELEKLIQA